MKPSRRDIMKRGYIDMGLYTITEAARLIKIPHAMLRRWIVGDPHGATNPLISNEIKNLDGQICLSFVNLIEAIFISRFAAYGIHVRSIRLMAEEAASFLNTPHPFATDILFKTDGQRICAYVEEQTGDPRLYDLKMHHWAMEPIWGAELKAAISYKESGIAHKWYPRQSKAKHVVLNPTAAFGQPVLDDSGIPTRAIYDSYIAEDRGYKIVAKWFEIPINRVKEAVRFESALTLAA